MKNIAYTGSSMLLMIALAIPSFAQTTRPPQQYKGGPNEYAEYNPLFSEKDPAKKAALAEKFLVDFKDSDYTTDVYQMLVQGYFDSQQWPKVIDAADRFEKSASYTSPFVLAGNKIVIFSDAATAAMQSGNLAKMGTYVDKELGADPAMTNLDTFQMLMNLSAAIPNALPADPAAKADALKRAADLTAKAQQSLDKLFSGPPPQGVTPEQWAGLKTQMTGQIHGTLGNIALNKLDYETAVTELTAANQSVPNNGVNFYLLGLAYRGEAVQASQKLIAAQKALNDAIAQKAPQPQIDDLKAPYEALQTVVTDKQTAAMDALGKGAALGGPAAAPARTQLEGLWKNSHNGTTDGLDDFINTKKGGL